MAQPVERGGSRPLAEAAALLESGRADEAETLLQEVLAAGSAPPYRAWHLLGRTQLITNRPHAALASLNESLRRAPQFVPALLGRAKAGIRLGAVEEAEADLRKAVSLDDSSPVPRLLLSEILLVGQDFGEARTWLAGLVADFGLGSESGRAARMLELAAAGRLEDLAALRVLVGESPDLAAGYLALGILQCRLDAVDDCEVPLHAALEIDAQDPVPWLVLSASSEGDGYPAQAPGLRARLEAAQSSLRAGELEGARRVAAEILAGRPHHVPARLLVIGAAERQEDYWEALAGYRQLLEWLPRVLSLEGGAARVARAMGALELAECWAKSAVETSPRNGSLHALLASVQADAGKMDEALESAGAAVALGETGAEAYLVQGRIHFERMRMDDALAAYRLALRSDVSAIEVMPAAALSALMASEGETLRAPLESYLGAHPRSPRALYQLGTMAMRGGDLEAAESYFERLSSVDTEDSQVHYNLGQIRSRAGDELAAEEAMDRFRLLKAEEEERWLAHNQAFRRRLEAREARESGRPFEAIRVYTELAAAGTANVEDYLAAGHVLLEIEDYPAAASWFEGLLSTAPYHRQAIEGLIEASLDGRQPERAELQRRRLELLASPCAEESESPGRLLRER